MNTVSTELDVNGTAHDLEVEPRRVLADVLREDHALQCGFCTPGVLMLLRGALDDDPTIVDDPERLEVLLASNLCRCTGYEGIRRAALRAAGR